MQHWQFFFVVINTTVFFLHFKGYFNLDIACHIEVIEADGSVLYAAISNLRISNADGTTFANDATASEVLETGQMRCDCAVVQVLSSAPARDFDFECRLFRARCPITSTFNTTIVTP